MFRKKKILMKVNNALFYCILNFENQKKCRNNVLQGAKLKKKLRKNSRVIYLFIYLFIFTNWNLGYFFDYNFFGDT